jgi:putative heme transporter
VHELQQLNRRGLIIGLIVTAAAAAGLYLLIPRLVGLNQTWGQLKHAKPWPLALGGLLELLSVAGYMVLFATVFGRGMVRVDLRASVEIPLAGIAAIRLFSAAGVGGVAVTAWALSRAGMSSTVLACRLVASYVIQYSLYLGALIFFGLGLWFGVFAGGGSFALTVLPAIVSTAVVLLVLSMALVPQDFERRLETIAQTHGRLGRLAARLAPAPATVGSGVRTALALVRQRRPGLLGAVAYWGFDIAVLGLSFKAFNHDLPLAVLVMSYFLGTLGSLLPLPGGVGGIEGGLIGAFAAFGVPGGRAVVGVLTYRAISFWLPTIPGIVGYLKLRTMVKGWRAADAEHAHE